MSSTVSTWWQGLPGPSRFRLYTRLTLQIVGLVVVVPLAVQTPSRWVAPGVVLTAIVGGLLLEAQPALATRPGQPLFGRRLIPAGIAALAAIWVAYALTARLAESEDLSTSAPQAGLLVCLVAALAVLPFARRGWWWCVGLGAVTGLAYGSGWPGTLLFGLVLVLFGAFSLASMHVTLYGLGIVDDLERARDLEGRLRVADERLRFSRDLHDVVGRGFSAIAVKSELAATLSRAGAADRAAAEMDEVKALAVESMEQLRRLVRAYRDIDLAAEVAGARSLLAAVGCTLDVQGDPGRVPPEFHELAAWATREGTTNVVRHATAATRATLAFGPAGMSLRNDGVTGAMNERSGLRGLAERAEAVGARLTAGTAEEEFVLEIVWQAP